MEDAHDRVQQAIEDSQDRLHNALSALEGIDPDEVSDAIRDIARSEIASLLGATLQSPESPALRAWAAEFLPQFGGGERKPGD